MKKYRISTTISLKHWALLKKHMEKYETQQKVLEHALECLQNSSKHSPILYSEEELWMQIGREAKAACIFQIDALKILIETVNIERFAEYIAQERPVQYELEFYYQKPLKECSLKDILDGIVINAKLSRMYDTINYTDDGDYYTLKITHNLGINNSKMLKIMYDSIFNSYGCKTESNISERSYFAKIYKTTG